MCFGLRSLLLKGIIDLQRSSQLATLNGIGETPKLKKSCLRY